MDEVETAAADTTSGSSPLAHSLPSLSPRHSSPPSPSDHARLPDASNPIHQSSSYKRNHSGKMVPVGIAHPLQQRQSTSSDPSKLPRETVEHSDSSCSVKNLEAGPSKKPKLDELPPLEKPDDQMSDSEEIASKVLEVDFFVSNSSSSEEEETQDLFKFTPPSYSMEEARTEERDEDDESTREEERDSQAFPPGKEWHMFVTHSTSDIDTVSAEILEPMALKLPPRKVTACMRFRNSSMMYDNAAIKAAMKTSCVVLVAFSKPYLDSSRCSKEWELAVTLSNSCSVVVAAIGQPCSRPAPLKRFLYLDFLDKHKRQIVWNKLEEVIDNTVTKPLTTQQITTRSSQPSEIPEAMSVAQNVFIEKDLHSEYYDIASSFESTVESLREKRKQQMEGERHGSTSSRGEASAAVAVKEEEQKDSKIEEKEEGEVKGEVEEGEVKDSSSAAEDSNGEYENSGAGEVAKWYDGLAKPDADKRNESPIFHMRNFNNWVKSVLIREYLPSSATVLDLCCGKGGDLLKWKEGSIQYLACADISKTSVETCEERYSTGRMLDRSRKPPFDAEFIAADCCEVRLRDLYQNEARRFHITSCQFSLHYSFESYKRAHTMLQNACENLRPDGYFIGTTVDSYELIRRLREAEQGEDGQWCIGNNIYSVTMDSDPNDVPLFGAKYLFQLHGVVNVPEYVVHFPLLVRMLAEFDMELVLHQNFYDFFEENRHKTYNAQLIYRMKAFNKKGTMSDDEWSAIGLYLVFVFKKASKSTL